MYRVVTTRGRGRFSRPHLSVEPGHHRYRRSPHLVDQPLRADIDLAVDSSTRARRRAGRAATGHPSNSLGRVDEGQVGLARRTALRGPDDGGPIGQPGAVGLARTAVSAPASLSTNVARGRASRQRPMRAHRFPRTGPDTVASAITSRLASMLKMPSAGRGRWWAASVCPAGATSRRPRASPLTMRISNDTYGARHAVIRRSRPFSTAGRRRRSPARGDVAGGRSHDVPGRRAGRVHRRKSPRRTSRSGAAGNQIPVRVITPTPAASTAVGLLPRGGFVSATSDPRRHLP